MQLLTHCALDFKLRVVNRLTSVVNFPVADGVRTLRIEVILLEDEAAPGAWLGSGRRVAADPVGEGGRGDGLDGEVGGAPGQPVDGSVVDVVPSRVGVGPFTQIVITITFNTGLIPKR